MKTWAYVEKAAFDLVEEDAQDDVRDIIEEYFFCIKFDHFRNDQTNKLEIN